MSAADSQYRDSSKLAARTLLNVKYSPKTSRRNAADVIDVQSGHKVLDVGCGPARIWHLLAQTVPADIEIALCDLSPGMVDVATALVRDLKSWRRLEGRVADVCALPFEDRAFDRVLAMHMLYHASDTEKAVWELSRVLRSDGKVFITTNGHYSMRELNMLSHSVFGTPLYEYGSAAFSLESGEPILRRHFGEVNVQRFVDVLRVTEAKDVKNYLLSFPPGETADTATLAKLDAAIEEAFASGGGVFNITRIAGYVTASRPS